MARHLWIGRNIHFDISHTLDPHSSVWLPSLSSRAKTGFHRCWNLIRRDYATEKRPSRTPLPAPANILEVWANELVRCRARAAPRLVSPAQKFRPRSEIHTLITAGAPNCVESNECSSCHEEMKTQLVVCKRRAAHTLRRSS